MDMMKFLKILFLWNPWSDLKKKIPKCSLGDPFENLFVNFDPSRNMALVDGGYLHLYRNEEFLKILPFEIDGQISKWTLQVTFWKLLSKIINLVSIPQKKNRLWLSQKFRWAIQGHLGPLVIFLQSSFRIREPVLAMRRTLMMLAQQEGKQDFDRDIGQSWLTSAKNAQK